MIPIELKLTNFISYGMMEEPLSFTSFHTASLCGPNGHGKSTLLDAITWALWGQARGVDRKGAGTDDLIKVGETGMAVEFVFELEGRRYRITRVRERKNKAGVTRLDFSVLEGDEARTLNGETIAKTQEKIERTLRMDFNTFTNSAFILQGRADSFMAKSPTERKEILAEILGLSLYDELEEGARSKKRDLEKALAAREASLIAIEGELSRRPEHEAALAGAMERASGLRAEIDQREKALADLREKKARREATFAQLEDLKRRLATGEAEIADSRKQLDESLKENQELAQLTGRATEIEKGAALLIKARADDERLAKLFARHSEVGSAIERVKGEIAAEEVKLRTGIEHLRKEKALADRQAANRPALLLKRDKCSATVDNIYTLEKQIEESRERYKELSRQKSELAGSKPSVAARIAELQENIKSIEETEAACPLCKKGLTPDERASLLKAMQEKLISLQAKAISTDENIARLSKEIGEVEAHGKLLRDQVSEKGQLQAELGRLKAELKGANEGTARGVALAGEIAIAESQLAEKSFALEASGRLDKLAKELREIGYDAGAHEEVRTRIKELASFEREAAQLEAAKQRASALEKTVESLKESIDKKTALIEGDEKRLIELQSELAEEDPTSNIRLLESEVTKLAAEEKSALARAAVATAAISRCDELVAERKAGLKERERTAAGIQTYSDLAVAFSKKGIPALIIENAVPEIEEEANAILRRLSDGRMSVRFLTQKGQRTTDNIVETLDLLISDGELGERKYELFSGGEAFRINFAIRIALSKLLTRRAGARLEMLVVDEGFGTQDEEGRDRLIESISAISPDFQKIIVITHLDELKEAFPARIEVTKQPGIGSVATVV
ncbi:MAG: SMC family ATPase [Actinobacteria bacterium]|nr:SMC family ATPase [Actinomycetota bacterium]